MTGRALFLQLNLFLQSISIAGRDWHRLLLLVPSQRQLGGLGIYAADDEKNGWRQKEKRMRWPARQECGHQLDMEGQAGTRQEGLVLLAAGIVGLLS